MSIKSTLAKRMVNIAKRLRNLVDEILASVGELAQIAEDYERERALCLRCGGPLDEEGRCPVCFERDRARTLAGQPPNQQADHCADAKGEYRARCG